MGNDTSHNDYKQPEKQTEESESYCDYIITIFKNFYIDTKSYPPPDYFQPEDPLPPLSYELIKEKYIEHLVSDNGYGQPGTYGDYFDNFLAFLYSEHDILGYTFTHPLDVFDKTDRQIYAVTMFCYYVIVEVVFGILNLDFVITVLVGPLFINPFRFLVRSTFEMPCLRNKSFFYDHCCAPCQNLDEETKQKLLHRSSHGDDRRVILVIICIITAIIAIVLGSAYKFDLETYFTFFMYDQSFFTPLINYYFGKKKYNWDKIAFETQWGPYFKNRPMPKSYTDIAKLVAENTWDSKKLYDLNYWFLTDDRYPCHVWSGEMFDDFHIKYNERRKKDIASKETLNTDDKIVDIDTCWYCNCMYLLIGLLNGYQISFCVLLLELEVMRNMIYIMSCCTMCSLAMDSFWPDVLDESQRTSSEEKEKRVKGIDDDCTTVCGVILTKCIEDKDRV